MKTKISNIETEWIPPHGLAKGYPWSGIASKVIVISRETFRHRNEDGVDKYYYTIDGNVMPDSNNGAKEAGYIFQEALKIAEDQLEYMLTEAPFNPEDFGFVAIVKPVDTTDVPITIYQSKFDENIIIFRKSKSDYGWTIQQKQTEGTMPPIKDIDVTLPCERIAYALFYALGIKVEE